MNPSLANQGLSGNQEPSNTDPMTQGGCSVENHYFEIVTPKVDAKHWEYPDFLFTELTFRPPPLLEFTQQLLLGEGVYLMIVDLVNTTTNEMMASKEVKFTVLAVPTILFVES